MYIDKIELYYFTLALLTQEKGSLALIQSNNQTPKLMYFWVSI